MKFGARRPSIKKSISARTTGRLKRSVKKATNPLYGKKGIGLINDPKKAVYNSVYSRTTFDATKSPHSRSTHHSGADSSDSANDYSSPYLRDDRACDYNFPRMLKFLIPGAVLAYFGFRILSVPLFGGLFLTVGLFLVIAGVVSLFL